MRYEADLDASGHGFRWQVARAGYAVVEDEYQYGFSEALEAGVPLAGTLRRGFIIRSNGPSPFGTCKTRADYEAWEREHVQEYAPVDRADLHRAFAGIQSTAEEALQFVNRHGLLTGGYGPPCFLDDFFAAQKLIRDICDQARRRAVAGSKVEEVINRNLSHFLLRVTVAPNGKLVHRLLPESLLGWMLLQAVRELTGSTWRACDVCRKPFEVRDEREGRRRFCSDRCRQKNFRDQRRG